MPVLSGYRRTTASTTTKSTLDSVVNVLFDYGKEGDVIARNEIDNHADTICAGPKWRVLEFTGEYCDVSPFSKEYQWRSVPLSLHVTVPEQLYYWSWRIKYCGSATRCLVV